MRILHEIPVVPTRWVTINDAFRKKYELPIPFGGTSGAFRWELIISLRVCFGEVFFYSYFTYLEVLYLAARNDIVIKVQFKQTCHIF